MAVWKNYIILHGGFRDLGTMTTYLNDVWLFDVTEFKWTQVEFPPNHPIPDARSGHSYCHVVRVRLFMVVIPKLRLKGFTKGKVLNDCWILK